SCCLYFDHLYLHSFPTRRSSDLLFGVCRRIAVVGTTSRTRNGDGFIFIGKRLEDTNFCLINPFNHFFTLFVAPVRIQILYGYFLAIKRWHYGRKWLGWPCTFVGHFTLRNRPFLDGPKRLTGDPIKYIKKACFGSHSHSIYLFAFMFNGYQLWCSC